MMIGNISISRLWVLMALPIMLMALLFVGTGSAGAATTIFSGAGAEAAFLAAVTGEQLESFEGLTPTGPPTTGAPLSHALTDFTVTSTVISGGNKPIDVFNAPDGFGCFATDGSQYLRINFQGVNMTYQFANTISGFGINYTDAEASNTLKIFKQGVEVFSTTFNTLPKDGFLGITDGGFDKVEFSSIGSGGDGVCWDELYYTFAEIEVEIDIKPGSDPNCFNNDGNGVIPVAILGSATFDATLVDDTTVQLAGMAVKAVGKKGKLLSSIEDVNGDGFADLVVKIEDTDGTFTPGNATATLTGNLLDGTPIVGTDSICITQ